MWQAPIILAEGEFMLGLLRQEQLLEQGGKHYFATMTNKCFNYQWLWGAQWILISDSIIS